MSKQLAILALWLACSGDGRPADRVIVARDAAPASGEAASSRKRIEREAIDAALDDSPETLARSFLAALASGDPARVRALYMAPENVTELVTCEKDPVLELREHLVEVEKQMGPTSSEVAFLRWDQSGRSVQRAGTAERGCTAKQDFELALGSVRFSVTSRKGTTRDSKILALVRIGDHWRVWKMSKL